MSKRATPANHRIATVITRIFDPFVNLSVVTIVGIFQSTLTTESKYRLLAIFLFGILAPPLLLFKWAVDRKHVGNWDLTDRRDRIIPMVALLVLLSIDFVVVRQFIDAFLASLFGLYVVFIIGLLVVTLFWKISGHSATIALATGLLVLWLGMPVYPLLVLVPVVAWSRVIRQNHTPAQVVGGAIYGWAVVFFFHFL